MDGNLKNSCQKKVTEYIQHEYHLHNSSKTGKSKQHIRDTYIDERTIHKNMGILNKKIQNVYLMWCVWKEETNEGF